MPSLHEVLQRVSDEPGERAIARHAWLEAHASDAYILLSSKDPLQTAFKMASRLKKLGTKFRQHKGIPSVLECNIDTPDALTCDNF